MGHPDQPPFAPCFTIVPDAPQTASCRDKTTSPRTASCATAFPKVQHVEQVDDQITRLETPPERGPRWRIRAPRTRAVQAGELSAATPIFKWLFVIALFESQRKLWQRRNWEFCGCCEYGVPGGRASHFMFRPRGTLPIAAHRRHICCVFDAGSWI